VAQALLMGRSAEAARDAYYATQVLGSLIGREAHIPALVLDDLIGMIQQPDDQTGPDARDMHANAVWTLTQWHLEPEKLGQVYSRLGVPGESYAPFLRAETPESVWKAMLAWAATPEASQGAAHQARRRVIRRVLDTMVRQPALLTDPEVRELMAATRDPGLLRHLCVVTEDADERQRYFSALASVEPDEALKHALDVRRQTGSFDIRSADLALILAGASAERRMEAIRLLPELRADEVGCHKGSLVDASVPSRTRLARANSGLEAHSPACVPTPAPGRTH
jgi:hypothetical protein